MRNRLTVFITFSVLLIMSPASAQRPAPGTGEDHSQLVAPGIYSVNWGEMGLNVGVFTGPDGVVLIDAQDEPAVPRLKQEIARISRAPVRFVINSHWHFDHVGGNETFAREGAVVIAQANTRTRLMSDPGNSPGLGKQRS